MKYDFSGYATRNNVKCSDGRVIMRDAFKDNDHKNVPLVWQHDHMSPDNVLGHAMLENREDGVYAYGCFNDTPSGLNAKELVKNGDVRALSIYANKLKQNGANVIHGAIREVSLVLAGANPGAYIDTVMVHSDGDEETEDAEICFNLNTNPILYHSDDEKDNPNKNDNPDKDGKKDEDMSNTKVNQGSDSDKTVQDVIDSMTEEQKNVLYTLVGMAADGSLDESEDNMKHNAFEDEDDYMAHSIDFDEILRDAKRCGSLRDSVIQHGLEDVSYTDYLEHGTTNYGIDKIDTLFPDFKSLNTPPVLVSRNMDWVKVVMNSVSHTPFSRIKSVFANITADEARARGYTKGEKKLEEVFTLLKRTTTPQTIYKKQKFDRDDVIDITEFDVVAWVKGEMRMMLDEEIARAVLIGDGRSDSSDDRIFPTNIRPVWQDDIFYTIRAQVDTKGMNTEEAKTEAIIKAIIRARKNYKGSGNPVFYTTEDVLTDMLLLENQIGDVKYKTKDELANRLRVSDIVTVEVMEGQTRKGDTSKGDVNASGAKDLHLVGLIVNLKDYNVGADKGGAVSMFDDFDIDYNQQKYLIETRCSGALIKPYAAISVETFTSSDA
nr:MAG: major capsid protein [Bacteriophage sp.]